MEVIGSEIGQKMRSAIKAKLTELGCYVDDELPDYVMVMVANKRTRIQMEEDLQLFLSENTEMFVNWLHVVLKKLQEVTVTTPIISLESNKKKERSVSKEKKIKVKKEKSKDKVKKIEVSKKSKKKDKTKTHRKKEEKKVHKSKKKSKHHEMIRPNIPPLLMNIEKDSEPSITDVFAGQILKNHGSVLDTAKEKTSAIHVKTVLADTKRSILPIIDPASITSQIDPNIENSEIENLTIEDQKGDQLKEIVEIEAKIQGLKQKLTEQLDSMSDDEDFLNIRTEAEELMNDFAEDVYQEISHQAPNEPQMTSNEKTPPPLSNSVVTKPVDIHAASKEPIETLPQIELNLPKRPVRERLGVKTDTDASEMKVKSNRDHQSKTPERFTPDLEPKCSKSAKSRLGDQAELKKNVQADESIIDNSDCRRVSSKISSEASAPRVTCASVVRVRPRPRVAASSSNLLLKAVADAHKSLLNVPPKKEPEPPKIKRALVLPMRRCVDNQNIVIQVPSVTRQHTAETDCKSEKTHKLFDRIENQYVPSLMTKKINNSEYVPTRRVDGRSTSRKDDTLVVETINIHHQTVDKEKDTKFIVTMDGFNPNAFLAKKLSEEGLLDDDDNVIKEKPSNVTPSEVKEPEKDIKLETDISPTSATKLILKKRDSNTSEESDTQVIIKQEEKLETKLVPETRNPNQLRSSAEKRTSGILKDEETSIKKRKVSPIVFNVQNKMKETGRKERERTESVGSDSVTISTTSNSSKYNNLPPLSCGRTAAAQEAGAACRSFPACRYGAACAFSHPRCKFAAACTRRHCRYSHSPLASQVVPAANYKSLANVVQPNMCKFYPNCVNPACHFYHPKPCRFGNACTNKLECNFYHSDAPVGKWGYSM